MDQKLQALVTMMEEALEIADNLGFQPIQMSSEDLLNMMHLHGKKLGIGQPQTIALLNHILWLQNSHVAAAILKDATVGGDK